MPLRRTLGSLSAAALLGTLLLTPGTAAAADTPTATLPAATTTTAPDSASLPILPPKHCIGFPLLFCPVFPTPVPDPAA